MLCKYLLTHEVMVMVMEECLPCIFMSLLFSCPLCLLVFSYGLKEAGIKLYSLLKVETWGIFGMRSEEVYVSWVILYVFESCYVKKMEEQVKTMCMSLTWEWKKKRTMRSNRRGIWGSWNLPPWLSTSCLFLLLLLKYEVFKSSLYVMINLGN